MIDNRPKYLHGKPLDLTTNQRFNLVIRILREEFPTNRPIKCRRVGSSDRMLKKLNAHGYTHLVNADGLSKDQYFIVVINRSLDWQKQLDVIMHEWAHAITWDYPSSQDHNREWANAYGKIYRRIIED